MENQVFELQYALDTFYFLVCGALVMWMAAGFSMLEAGLVRAKNTTEILTKNVALFAISCTMYLICGYSLMYGGSDFSLFLSGITADGVAGAAEPATYAPSSDFFFQVVFVATAMSIVSGAVAERMRLWAFLAFAVVMTGLIYPLQ
ncbi:MAG: ammonium transporter, partial [Pseudomonadales bacterium]